jgi:hypothetical protein
MALVLPDLIIVDTLNLALIAIREDYKTCVDAGEENRSILYLLFNGLTTGKYNIYDNVKKLVLTTPESPKHIEVVSAFQSVSGKAPSVYITMPSENDRNNSLGIGQGNADELTFDNVSPDQDEYRDQYMRRYNTNYYVVMVCENRNEMVILYNLFKYILVMCTNHFALCGIENMKIGGQDLKLNDAIPDKLFMRGISMNFEYEQLAPELAFKKIYSKVRLYWKLEGATIAQGPIDFTA